MKFSYLNVFSDTYVIVAAGESTHLHEIRHRGLLSIIIVQRLSYVDRYLSAGKTIYRALCAYSRRCSGSCINGILGPRARIMIHCAGHESYKL